MAGHINKRLLADMGEFGFIDFIRKKARRGQGVLLGIGDDSAVIDVGARDLLLVTTDMLLEGVHFFSSTRPQDIGYKALACSVSDIAAMGGMPAYALVSLGISPRQPVSFARKLLSGFNRLADKFHISLVGGDTVNSAATVINVALLGKVRPSELVCRRGARPGDLIYVTGKCGGSLRTGRHLRFLPRVREARFLAREIKPTAMIDISDGLAADLGHILKESHVGADIFKEHVPIHRGATFEQALYDGEDFELLFTLPPHKAKRLQKGRRGFTFYLIGEIHGQAGKLFMKEKNGRRQRLTEKGFDHFR